MNTLQPQPVTTPPAAYLHADAGVVFWVLAEDGTQVGATISKATLHYCFKAEIGGSDALATYAAHRDTIDAAVRRRLAKGAREPVMLRESDFAATPLPPVRP